MTKHRKPCRHCHCRKAWQGGTNYVEWTMTAPDPAIGPFTLTVQRKHGQTPAEVAGELRKERDRLAGQVAQFALAVSLWTEYDDRLRAPIRGPVCFMDEARTNALDAIRAALAGSPPPGRWLSAEELTQVAAALEPFESGTTALNIDQYRAAREALRVVRGGG